MRRDDEKRSTGTNKCAWLIVTAAVMICSAHFDERRNTIATADGVTVPRKGFDQRFVYAIRTDTLQPARRARGDNRQVQAVTWTDAYATQRKIERLPGDPSTMVSRSVYDDTAVNR